MEPSRHKILIILALAISLLSGGLLVYLLRMAAGAPAQPLRNDGFYQYDAPIVLGDFSLIDHTGKAFDREAVTGKWTLVFFGYTFCPDICPLTMASIRQFYRLLEENGEAKDVQVAMISVDPKRDTAEVMGNYVTYFNPDFFGVTGEFADIYALSSRMNVAFTYTPIDAENYLVSHNGEIMLVDPAGANTGFFKAPYEPESMLDNFRAVKRRWSD